MAGPSASTSDTTDGQYTTRYLNMQRSYSMDSALNSETNMHINAYDNIIYEIESESEERDFLMGNESDTGSAARARVVPKRKTQPKRQGVRGKTAAPRARRNVREKSMDVDIENDS